MSYLFFPFLFFVKIVVHIASYYFKACKIFILVSLLNGDTNNLYFHFSPTVLLGVISYITLCFRALDCYNKMPQTGKLINNRKLFIIVLEVGHLIARYQEIWCGAKPSCLLSVSSEWQEG